ncbi:hypothetical protein ACLQ2E_17875 [Streptomyces lavendulocolor]
MRAGDTLRFRGPAGAEFVVTVGAAFDERTISARIASGEWIELGQAPATDADGLARRPAVNAHKGDWVDYAVDHHGLPREDAEAMTKQQLIDTIDAAQAPTSSSEENTDGQ